MNGAQHNAHQRHHAENRHDLDLAPPTPVSYTHLDVYKRQALHHAVYGVSAAAANADHFDVRYILQFFIEDKGHESSLQRQFL